MLSLSDLILQVSYIPDPPRFTIRHITNSIQAVDRQWHVYVIHPPSLEQRAQQMQIREQRRLLLRIALASTVAIPTFVLGVVFASLVVKGNAVRLYMEERMWAGRASSHGFASNPDVHGRCRFWCYGRAGEQLGASAGNGHPISLCYGKPHISRREQRRVSCRARSEGIVAYDIKQRDP